jgi:hypothetical protein
MRFDRAVNDLVQRLLRAQRRTDRYYRDAFDRLARPPIVAATQWLINARRRDEGLGIAEERLIPGEERITGEIIERMTAFLRQTYSKGLALRAGNTKTHGLVRGFLEVMPDLPDELRHGLFRESRGYAAWVRFAGPGPLAPADMDDNGILSLSIKVMGVPGGKLLDDERWTQDFTGISAPTFTTPDVVENLKLQRHIGDGTPALYFLSPTDPHLLDAVMQGVYARAQANPLELRYDSCVPYLLGEGRAMKYSVRPRVAGRSRVPSRPGPNDLRAAMARTLESEEAVFDLMVQLQTDPHRMPIENASVIWPERLSPSRRVATLRIPAQYFTSGEQLEFDRYLSFNPWHALPEHRPLGNQNRARRQIYLHLSRARREMNRDRHIEPDGSESFPGSPPLLPTVTLSTPDPLAPIPTR